MDLTPSTEQLEIIDSSAAFLRDRWPITQTREMFGAAANVDSGAWRAAAEVGWFGLGLPESMGGIGCGLADEALLFREIGRSLSSGPMLSSVLGARVAAFGGHAELAGRIIGGEERVGLVVPGSCDLVGPDGVVSGDVQLLDADGTLALIATPESAVLVEVGALDDVVTVACIDPAVRLRRAVANRVAPVVAVRVADDAIERRGHVLAAAMLTGITEAVRDIASEHAKNRVQFNRPIGVNQAIKHPCADMAVRAQLSLAQTLFAALTTDEGREDADFHALSAHLVAAEAAEFATAATVQILGGIGYSFEHDAHLYVKRTHVMSRLFGGIAAQLTRLLGQPAPR